MAFVCIHKFIFICLTFTEMTAMEVNFNSSVSTTVGKDNVHLNCSVTPASDITIYSIIIAIHNTSIDSYFAIASFSTGKGIRLTTYGAYLEGRVNLSQFPIESGIATLLFNEIKCEDANAYLCTVLYEDGKGPDSKTSKPINIHILTPPSKPEHINSNALISKIQHGQYVTFICQGRVGNPPGRFIWRKRRHSNITTYSDTVTITKEISGQCTFEGTSNLTIQLQLADNKAVIDCFEQSHDLENMTTRTQPLHVICSATTPSQITPITLNRTFENGEFVTFACEGNIGNPPSRLIWKKYFYMENFSINYSNVETRFEEIPNSCSMYGKSSLTIQLSHKDYRATIACLTTFNESELSSTMLSLSTEPLNVLFVAREISVATFPRAFKNAHVNSKLLTCHAKGNPSVNYTWYERKTTDKPLSTNATISINSSGEYICIARNSFNGKTYRVNDSIVITLGMVEKENTLLPIILAITVGFVMLVALLIVALKIKRMREKKNMNSNQGNTSDVSYYNMNQISTLPDVYSNVSSHSELQHNYIELNNTNTGGQHTYTELNDTNTGGQHTYTELDVTQRRRQRTEIELDATQTERQHTYTELDDRNTGRQHTYTELNVTHAGR